MALGHLSRLQATNRLPFPLENELALSARGARFTLFFAAVYGIDLDQLSILNSQAHMATQAVIDVATFEAVSWLVAACL